MVLSKYLDPKNDFAFRRIFGTEKNKEIVIHFLNDMLGFQEGEKIQQVTFLKTVQDPEIAAKKQSIVDVLCIDEQGCQYIVEMQVAHVRGFEKRAQYYAAKAYVSQINQGEAYHNLKRIIFLAITDFLMFPDTEEYKSDHVILDKNSHEHYLKDFYFCFLELPKFNKTIEELNTMVEKWAYFFKHASETSEKELDKITGSDIVIRKAYDVLNQYSWSEEELRTYEQEKKRELDAKAIMDYALNQSKAQGIAEGITQGITRGIAQGNAEGEKKAQLKFAKNLLKKGYPLDEIMVLTGLSKEEIESIEK
jgi:predicted transposase/invertase (TIGR01784 family)